ncbi:MAG: hypothetical protein WBA57_04245 [Elainellaceae cyanobacterium]
MLKARHRLGDRTPRTQGFDENGSNQYRTHRSQPSRMSQDATPVLPYVSR